MAQNRGIISRGIIRIARMVRSSLSTGIRRSETICSKVPTHRRYTKTCTTSTMGRKTTSLKTRPIQARLYLVRPPNLANPSHPHLLPVRRGPRLNPLHIHPRLTVFHIYSRTLSIFRFSICAFAGDEGFFVQFNGSCSAAPFIYVLS